MAKLRIIHRNFYHPKSESPYSIPKISEGPNATHETLKQLENFERTFEGFQIFSKIPGRMRVSFPLEEIIFDRVFMMDLTNIDGEQVLHIVDKDLLFSAAVIFFSEGESAKINVGCVCTLLG